jgi:hypothetical protein
MDMELVKEGRSTAAGMCTSGYDLDCFPGSSKSGAAFTVFSNGCLTQGDTQTSYHHPLFKVGDKLTMEVDTAGATAAVKWWLNDLEMKMVTGIAMDIDKPLHFCVGGNDCTVWHVSTRTRIA